VVMAKLVRLSVEKLDRVRLKACATLLELAPALPTVVSHFSNHATLATDVLSTSSRPYFSTLLPLSSVPEIRDQLLAGYVTSAAAGADSLLKSSRSALLSFLDTAEPSLSSDITTALLTIISENFTTDRVLVPALEVVGLLLEMELLPLTPATGKKLYVLTAKAHFKSSNVNKLTAAVGVYRALACTMEGREEMIELKRDVVKKLCMILGHPFPPVRVCAAEALWVCLVAGDSEDQVEVMKTVEGTDWGKKAVELKGVIEGVKKGLKVDGK